MPKSTIKEERIIAETRLFRIYEREVEHPDGKIEKWEQTEYKGEGVRIFAVTPNQNLILIREFRSEYDEDVSPRLPTGNIDEGETAEDATRRELREETGYEPQNIEPIEVMGRTSSYYRNTTHLMFCSELIKVGVPEKNITLLPIPFHQIHEKINDLFVVDPFSIYGILRGIQFLQGKKQIEYEYC